MKIDTDKKYPGKLLLFGEYTVLVGSQAFAIPLNEYFGSWIEHQASFSVLSKFWHYLISECSSFLDMDMLEYYSTSCIFHSNIPQASGLGSSGALTAAIYDVAGFRNVENDPKLTRSYLAKIESFFHGKSSGFDPLVSYYNRSIVQKNDGSVAFPSSIQIPKNLFLYHSGDPRTRSGLIPLFLEKNLQKGKQISKLVDQNNEIIDCILNDPKGSLESMFRTISKIQWELMPEYISPKMIELWRLGLELGRYSIKLCGAGGGGYYLVYLHEPNSFPQMEKLIPITRDNSLNF